MTKMIHEPYHSKMQMWQFQCVYTHAKLKEVQFESREKKEKKKAMVGQLKTECMFKVKFNRSECFVGCSCLMFEFKGLLCMHALTVLSQEKVTEVSSRYVLDPWRNDIRLKCCSRSWRSYCIKYKHKES